MRSKNYFIFCSLLVFVLYACKKKETQVDPLNIQFIRVYGNIMEEGMPLDAEPVAVNEIDNGFIIHAYSRNNHVNNPYIPGKLYWLETDVEGNITNKGYIGLSP